MSPLDSIIVPVYNSERYIDECIKGVLKQSYDAWELLLIDDGSDDNSYAVCNKYGSHDSRILAISKENSGVSRTRNLGLDMSKGEYIIFLDSDDYWQDVDFLKTFVELAENNSLDVVRGEYEEVDCDRSFLARSKYISSRKYYDGKIIDSTKFYSEIIKKEYFSVLCLYRKNVFDDLRFNINKVFLEDAEFYLDLCLKELACMYVQIFFYAYRKHSESVSVKDVPNKFRNALDFTLVCFNKSFKANDSLLSLSYRIDGVQNYLFDLQVIGESDASYNEIQQLYISHKILSIREHVKERIIGDRLYRYIYALLSLNIIVYYYRYILKIKLYIIRVLRKLKLYD